MRFSTHFAKTFFALKFFVMQFYTHQVGSKQSRIALG